MAIKTKTQAYERLQYLEDKLYSIIPEDEKDTPRAATLDKVANFVGGGEEQVNASTLKDMTSLIKEAEQCMAVEAEIKKASKESKAETEKPKKGKKLGSKKKADAKVEKKSEKKAEPVEEFQFPETLDTDAGTYALTTIQTLDDVREDDLVAAKWTEQDLKKFYYDTVGRAKPPKKFDKDIDVCTISGTGKVAKVLYAMSVFTDKMYEFYEADIADMTCPGDMPWAVYRLVA